MKSATKKLLEPPLVYVIVLNWNGKEHLEECFRSLMGLDYTNVRFLMVDNAARDGMTDYVSSHFSSVEIIPLKQNIGFGGGNNVGIRHAIKQGADYIALLNNDTAVHPRWISELVAAAEENPSAGVFASKMLYHQNWFIINGVGVIMNRLCHCWDNHNMRFKNSVRNSEQVIAACGGAFFIRRECIQEAGVFDPAYFLYLEDVDLCIRIRQLGYDIITVPQAMIYHKFSSGTVEGSPWKNYFLLRNRLTILFKLFPSDIVFYALPRILYHEFRLGLKWFCNTEFKRNLYQFMAVASVLCRLPKLIYLRVKLKKLRGNFPRHLIHPSHLPPDFPPIYRHSPPEKTPSVSRLFMGVNDQALQEGWFPMEAWDSYDGNIMKYRKMSEEAKALLYNPSDGSNYIQIQAAQAGVENQPNRLHLFWNGNEIGCFIPDLRWKTYHLKAEIPRGMGEILLRGDHISRSVLHGAAFDASFKIAEISILEDGSPFLRNNQS